MYDWQDFNAVFHQKGDVSPDQKHVEAVLKHRKELNGTLFFDRIWTTVKLKQPAKWYPPKSHAELVTLWAKIVKTDITEELKLSLLYYLVKDCRKPKIEAEFIRKSYIPEKFRLLVAGLWELDHCEFSRALDFLTDPSLTPTFVDEILEALLKHPKCDDSLAMAYYIAVRPPLQKRATLDTYFALLSRTNVIQAFHFARQNDANHKHLFEDLVYYVHDQEPGPTRADRAMQLISLPFTEEENTWFEEALLHGKAAKCNGAKDSILMRRLACGKLPTGSSAVDRLKGPKIDSINWEDIRNTMPS